MFDIYSNTNHADDKVIGKLVKTNSKTGLLYLNTQIVGENGASTSIPVGQSYEIIDLDGENLSIDFESKTGLGDGVSESMLLEMLIHRTQSKIENGLFNDADAAMMLRNALTLSLDIFSTYLADGSVKA